MKKLIIYISITLTSLLGIDSHGQSNVIVTASYNYGSDGIRYATPDMYTSGDITIINDQVRINLFTTSAILETFKYTVFQTHENLESDGYHFFYRLKNIAGGISALEYIQSSRMYVLYYNYVTENSRFKNSIFLKVH